MIGTRMLTPQEIFDAYAVGRMARSEMIQRIADYPFVQEPDTDGYDWITPPAQGPTWRDVTQAKRQKIITRDDYAEIFELRNNNR